MTDRADTDITNEASHFPLRNETQPIKKQSKFSHRDNLKDPVEYWKKIVALLKAANGFSKQVSTYAMAAGVINARWQLGFVSTSSANALLEYIQPYAYRLPLGQAEHLTRLVEISKMETQVTEETILHKPLFEPTIKQFMDLMVGTECFYECYTYYSFAYGFYTACCHMSLLEQRAQEKLVQMVHSMYENHRPIKKRTDYMFAKEVTLQ